MDDTSGSSCNCKDGSTLRHGENKRGKEETKHHANEQLRASNGYNAAQSIMPTMSIKQPRNLLVPVHRLARDFSRSRTYFKKLLPPFGHAILALLANMGLSGKMLTKIGQLLSNVCSTFVQLLSNFCSTFEARAPLQGPPKEYPKLVS